MKEHTEQFEQLMKKLQLNKPVSKDDREFIRLSKKRQFKKILKRAGHYSIFMSLVTSIFFFLKKMGFGISFLKTIWVAVLTASIFTVSLVSGGYFVVKYVVFQDAVVEEPQLKEQNVPEALSDKIEKNADLDVKETSSKKAKINYTIVALKSFAAEDLNRQSIKNIASKISAAIRRNKKNIKIVNYRKSLKNVKYYLAGSVDLLENSYIIYVKLIDAKSSKIILSESVTAESEDKINSACKKLAKKISIKL